MSISPSFDKRAIYKDCIFALPLKKGTGNINDDFGKGTLRHTSISMGGPPAWTTLSTGIQVLDFNSANPDFIHCIAARSTDLDFTSGNFSCAMWVYMDSIANLPYLMCRGLANTDGWAIQIHNFGNVMFFTWQAGAQQMNLTYNWAVNVNLWLNIVVVRNGTRPVFYVNGLDKTFSGIVSIVNPLTANRDLHIGIYDDHTTSPFDGKLWYPRIWSRALSALEVKYIFETERRWFGV